VAGRIVTFKTGGLPGPGGGSGKAKRKKKKKLYLIGWCGSPFG
jgi:hypothetical protein